MSAHQPASPQSLLESAREFRGREKVYSDYVGAARETLITQVEERIQTLRDQGVATDATDSLLNQLRGLRSRHQEVDAITRSLLLQSGSDPVVMEELVAAITALVAMELEAKTAQSRHAMAAVLREYLGGHDRSMRDLVFRVESTTSRSFNSLLMQVRERQSHLFGRSDTFTKEDLLTRLLALGSVHRDLLAGLGSPALVNLEKP